MDPKTNVKLKLDYYDKHCLVMYHKEICEILCLYGLDVDKNYVSHIERRTRPINDIELIAIKEVWGVTYDYLFEEM